MVREMLTDIGIGQNDLELLFRLMDTDDSGVLSYCEFIDAFLKAQTQNPKVYLMIMQLRVQKIEMVVSERLDEHLQDVEDQLRAFFLRFSQGPTPENQMWARTSSPTARGSALSPTGSVGSMMGRKGSRRARGAS